MHIFIFEIAIIFRENFRIKSAHFIILFRPYYLKYCEKIIPSSNYIILWNFEIYYKSESAYPQSGQLELALEFDELGWVKILVRRGILLVLLNYFGWRFHKLLKKPKSFCIDFPFVSARNGKLSKNRTNLILFENELTSQRFGTKRHKLMMSLMVFSGFLLTSKRSDVNVYKWNRLSCRKEISEHLLLKTLPPS